MTTISFHLSSTIFSRNKHIKMITLKTGVMTMKIQLCQQRNKCICIYVHIKMNLCYKKSKHLKNVVLKVTPLKQSVVYLALVWKDFLKEEVKICTAPATSSTHYELEGREKAK